MNNPYLGEVSFLMCGKSHTLVLNWEALATIYAKYGDDAFDKLKDGLGNTRMLADVLCACLKTRHPEVTPEDIMKLSPPIMETMAHIDLALTYAVYGKIPEKSPSAGAQDEAADAKKKTK